MSDCCSSGKTTRSVRNTHTCPSNKQVYSEVTVATVLHHIRHGWNYSWQDKRFYFCDDPDCDVVYFSDDDAVITQPDLSTKVGIKSDAEDAMICYCFGVTQADARQDPSIKDFVIQQTKSKFCTCETSNPSGKCCLKNFPK